MSIVILKVNKEEKTHSIWSDGIMISGKSEISYNSEKKISHIHIPGYDILIGTTGDVTYGNYIRRNFIEEFKKDSINDFSDTDVVEGRLINIFRKLWHGFCDENGINYKSDEYSATTLMSINGTICLAEMYEDNVINAFLLDGTDKYAIGQCYQGAMAMMDLCIEAEIIIKALSKHNCYINDNVRSFKEISYEAY